MIETAKQLAGERAADYVREGQTVGLGTGSTAYYAIVRLGARVAEGLKIRGIPTSESSAALAREHGVPLVDFAQVDRLDVTIDGADEIDPGFNLIKGGGGALLREKIVAGATDHQIIVADDSKWKQVLGAFPLPVEITPFGWQATSRRIAELGVEPAIRPDGDDPFVTDNGNYILDCPFVRIPEPGALEASLRSIPGVVECGLFVSLTDRVILGRTDGTISELTEPEQP